MSRIVVSMMVSVDGFIEGPGRSIDWHVFDQGMEQYMTGFFDTVDTILLGRVAYELMETYWPTPLAKQEYPVIAARMNDTGKIVFSRTLSGVSWENTRLIRDDIKAEMLQLKARAGKDITLFGGAEIISTFRQLDLIDEYQLFVNPVVLGWGTPLFKDLQERLQLELTGVAKVGEHNALLTYVPGKR